MISLPRPLRPPQKDWPAAVALLGVVPKVLSIVRSVNLPARSRQAVAALRTVDCAYRVCSSWLNSGCVLRPQLFKLCDSGFCLTMAHPLQGVGNVPGSSLGVVQVGTLLGLAVVLGFLISPDGFE